jgi:hypothetical protein
VPAIRYPCQKNPNTSMICSWRKLELDLLSHSLYMGERLKDSRSNWQNMNLPHPMSPQWGGSFYLGRLGPGETSPVTFGFEEAKV